MGMSIGPVDRGELSAARAVLAAACAFDRAEVVADEKLFGDAPAGPATALAARADGTIVGVAALSGHHLRLLAVSPDARGAGIGSALLAAAENQLRAAGVGRARAVSQPGNYLAPGIDERNADTVAW